MSRLFLCEEGDKENQYPYICVAWDVTYRIASSDDPRDFNQFYSRNASDPDTQNRCKRIIGLDID